MDSVWAHHGYIRRNKDIFENAGVNCNNILKCKNLRDIDKLLTKKYLNLRIFLIIINHNLVKNDPIIPENVIDKKVCKKNTNVLLVVNPWGGHLGFLKDSLSQSLADEIIVEFSLYFE
ncbi:alpha beta hydrolase fold protein [Vairimorpha apis BRL 01]|uniref:Alpha beta hydrolase fold protein n=1 Tax=Vairimorpha apis BRL 01 TaxID=1037528 RepID=T0L094_9MICR|nr:alpha beta hydrolase fold protein [Vairimorpha apis BRL 01]